jgi:hypothetical protein
MSSTTAGGHISIDTRNLGRGYQKPYVISTRITNNKNGHSMRRNIVIFKYPNFKKYDYPNVHVGVFNFAMKTIAKTSKSISSMHLTIC